MLQLAINGAEFYDEKAEKFIKVRPQVLQLEHSLVSISKWESKWHKPFLDTTMTQEQTVDYIRFMTITQNVDPLVYSALSPEDVKKVISYIDDPMTATIITDSKIGGNKKSRGRKQVLTNEVIYYYMTAYNIPFDPCQKWHFNRLLTLIRVCDEKNQPPKKMSGRQIAMQNRSLNDARKAKMHTRG